MLFDHNNGQELAPKCFSNLIAVRLTAIDKNWLRFFPANATIVPDYKMAIILAVDDEPMTLRLCTTILKRGQHEVLQAAGAQQALQLLEDHPVDLALLDVIMPGMNGIMLAGRIRSRHPASKILLMTGYGPREIAQIAGKENPYRIIWKPFTAESLLRMVENVLGESEVTPSHKSSG